MAEQAAKRQDDSMEDILHSIRDIIADEDGEEVEVLELTEVVEDAMPSQAQEPEDPQEDISLSDVTQEDLEANIEQPAEEDSEEVLKAAITAFGGDVDNVEDTNPKVPAEDIAEEAMEEIPQEISQQPTPQEDALLSQDKAEASSAALKNLMDNIPRPQIDSPSFRAGHTLEDLVIETLKPMLSEWLNENLPVIVEDLVQKEIRKLIPRE